MVNLRFSPMARMLYRPTVWEDDEQEWPSLTMTDGLDVYEDGEHVVVKAAVPGVPADKVEVTFEDGVLHVKARTEETEEEKKRKKVIYRMDRVASFDYTATLPRPIDDKSIDAEVVDGVVVVRAKIAEAAKPKRIEVRSK
ncbi:Hsp20/alpha crystallin family protein [Candidatus Roizmanbacteria bacterium]|nr:Hsp20/alpha crystallin family protein [Candidatus Roizmanbacteria bacterium]